MIYMCIESSILIYENVHIESINFYAFEVYDNNRNLVESVKSNHLSMEEEYESIIRKTSDCLSVIIGMGELTITENENFKTSFDIYKKIY